MKAKRERPFFSSESLLWRSPLTCFSATMSDSEDLPPAITVVPPMPSPRKMLDSQHNPQDDSVETPKAKATAKMRTPKNKSPAEPEQTAKKTKRTATPHIIEIASGEFSARCGSTKKLFERSTFGDNAHAAAEKWVAGVQSGKTQKQSTNELTEYVLPQVEPDSQ